MAAPPRVCYYQLLEVTSAADDEEVKKAYRRQALVWHPDKNLHRLEEATERFKQVQEAYAVLSDPGERAWYDRHREEILSSGRSGWGGAGGSGGDGDDGDGGGASHPRAANRKLFNLVALFSASAYTGYDDSETGFYTVYRAAFAAVAAEEGKYADPESGAGATDHASFGSSTSSAAEVMGFYRDWAGYVSRMHFGWADRHNPADAPNRWMRRQMEKENRAARAAARRDRIEEVRALVAFVQRRDKRYLKSTVEARAKMQAEEERRKAAAMEVARATAEARAREVEAMAAMMAARERELAASGAYRVSTDVEDKAWGGVTVPPGGGGKGGVRVVRAPWHGGGTGSGGDDNGDADGCASVLVCEVCNKTFRSEAAFANHERSKKHQSNVAALGLPASNEDEEPGGAEIQGVAAGEGSPRSRSTSTASSASTTSTATITTSSSSSPSARKSDSSGSTSGGDDDDALLSLLHGLRMGRRGAGRGKQNGPWSSAKVAVAASEEEEEEDGVGDSVIATPIAPPTAGGSAPGPAPVAEAAESKKPARKKAGRGKAGGGSGGAGHAAPPAATLSMASPVGMGGSKGVPLHARLNASMVEAALRAGASTPVTNDMHCSVCGATFSSRNKLFAHVRETGHAVPLEDRDGGGGRGGKKGSNKRR